MKTCIFCTSFISFVAAQADSQQDILNAIKNNSGDAIKQTLLDVVQQGQAGKTPESILLKAIMSGTADEIKQALQPVINQGKNNIAPITWAVLLRKSDAVKTLLDCGASIDSTIVQYAVKMGDLKAMLEIVKSGTDISEYMQDYMRSCIRARDLSSNSEIVLELIQELINHGYNVNDVWKIQANDGSNIYEAFGGKALRLLLKNNANPNQVITGNQWGETPLLIAIFRRNKQAVEILLGAGTDINQKGLTFNGRRSVLTPLTPLSYAVEIGCHEVVELLLERGASL